MTLTNGSLFLNFIQPVLYSGVKIYLLCQAHKKNNGSYSYPPKDRDIKASWPPRICQGKREVWTGNTRPEKLLIRIQSDGKKFPLIPMCDHIYKAMLFMLQFGLPKISIGAAFTS